MIAVAATAVGLAPARYLLRGLDRVEGGTSDRYWAMRFVVCATPVFYALTLAALAISLRQPRPRRLHRLAGFVGCLSAAVCLTVVEFIELGGTLLAGENVDIRIATGLIPLHQWAAGAVAGAWIALWGRWRTNALDGAGIAVGLGWFALAIVWCVQRWIMVNG